MLQDIFAVLPDFTGALGQAQLRLRGLVDNLRLDPVNQRF